jgi:APA family basic amino acid/polyamine antiporter
VPALYVLAATTLVVVLFLYRTETTLPGLLIVLTGLPVYALWRRFGTVDARETDVEGRAA